MATGIDSSNRSLMMKMYAWIIVSLMFLLGWMVSGSCYFNRATYRAMAWSLPAMAAAWTVVYARSFRRRGYVIRMQQVNRKLKPFAVPFHIAAIGGLLGGATWFVLYAFGCLTLMASSREEARSIVTLHITHLEGHCGTSYAFFDPRLDRQVSDCGLPYRNAQSGDSVIVMRTAGPLGIHLQSVSPSRYPGDTRQPQ